MNEPPQPAHPRVIRSYVKRGGRMGSGQIRALQTLVGQYRLPFQPGLLDLAATFGRIAPLVVEIGFGMGDATLEMARADPATDWLGIEVHEAGVGALMHKVDSAGLANVRIIQHDAVEVLQHMMSPDSLAGIHLYFPDPWPKKRHHKRRLVQQAWARLAASRLAPGGRLHCATDWEPYAQQMLAVLGAEPTLANTAAGFAERPAWRPLTKFEARGQRLGHGSWDVLFLRR
ncbi:MAG: tRNA (guanosine(46)-N7)-methyltransferase TrmB [Aquabacterium sp.]